MITVVRIDQPRVRNAIDAATAQRLHDEFVAFDADPTARVAVLYGDEQAHVLQAQAGLVERPLELEHRAGLVQAGVHEHHAVHGRDGERVHVRDARPGQRQPKPPEAGQHAVRAGQLTPPSGHGSTRTPGLRMPAGSTAAFAARSASANGAGRWRSYQGRWSRPTAW